MKQFLCFMTTLGVLMVSVYLSFLVMLFFVSFPLVSLTFIFVAAVSFLIASNNTGGMMP